MPRDLQSLVDELSDMLRSVATLEDKNFNLVTFSSQSSDVDPVRHESILRRTSSQEIRSWFEQFGIATAAGPVRTPADPIHGTVARVCLPARWRGRTYGYFWFLDDRGEIDETRLPAAMSIAAQAGAILAQHWRARQDVQLSTQALLGPDPDLVERAAEELEDLHVIKRDTPVVAVVCRVDRGAEQPEPLNLWALPRHILVSVTTEGVLSAVVPLRQVGDLSPGMEAAARIMELVGERLGAVPAGTIALGVGAARSNVREIRGSWLEAKLAATVARSEPRFSPVARWCDLGVHRLLACGPRSALTDAVLDPAVVRLLEYHSDDLATTAATFLQFAGNVQKTAAALGVHRQTLYYRLKRIEEVTGLGLDRGRDRLVLHLGLELARSLGAVRPPP